MPFSKYVTATIPLTDYSKLQSRYLGLDLISRAQKVYEDAQAAVTLSQELIEVISQLPESKKALTLIRNDAQLVGRLRNSEAKMVLMDSNADYFSVCKQKIAAWHLAISRLIQKEDVIEMNGDLVVPADSALGTTLTMHQGVSCYLAILPVVLGELSQLDAANASQYAKTTAQIRRCGTLISDCETASELISCVKAA